MTTAAVDFVGWSGIWVSPDGSSLVGVEEGTWVRANLIYDSVGNLQDFRPVAAGLLHDDMGQPLADGGDSDAEALDFDGKEFFVGFETNNRVLRYRDIDGPGFPLPIPSAITDTIFRGTGFSSVAVIRDGSVIALPEYAYATASDRQAGAGFTAIPTRGWMETPFGAGPISLRAALPSLPVALANLPNGDLLTAEVHLQDDRSIDRAEIGLAPGTEAVIGGMINPCALATFAPPMPAWRIEGATARPGPNGETLLYLLSTSAPPVLYMFALPADRGCAGHSLAN
ncbi:MAG: esterase-like activity of phytase family protein [Alteraurantiacibacter sp.]